MPSTQHTQACLFIKITVQNSFLFYLQPLEIDDQDREPSENSFLKSRNRCDQDVRSKSFWLMTRFRFSGPGHGQGRQNTPLMVCNKMMRPPCPPGPKSGGAGAPPPPPPAPRLQSLCVLSRI